MILGLVFEYVDLKVQKIYRNLTDEEGPQIYDRYHDHFLHFSEWSFEYFMGLSPSDTSIKRTFSIFRTFQMGLQCHTHRSRPPQPPDHSHP